MPMEYSPEILEKVRAFGVLSYSVDRLIHLIDPSDVNAFRADIETPSHQLYKAYNLGRTTGQYNLDKELFDLAIHSHNDSANIALHQRMHRNRIDELIYRHFGL